jgi:hypothetical protein
MRLYLPLAFALALPGAALAQQIVEIPASEVDIVRPEDLFTLEPDRWHLARQLWRDYEPCTATQCEAGFTSGNLAVSAEHNSGNITISAVFRNCSSTAYSQFDVGERASSGERKKIARQVKRVVSGLGKTCKLDPPVVAPLTGDWLFPAAAAG